MKKAINVLLVVAMMFVLALSVNADDFWNENYTQSAYMYFQHTFKTYKDIIDLFEKGELKPLATYPYKNYEIMPQMVAETLGQDFANGCTYKGNVTLSNGKTYATYVTYTDQFAKGHPKYFFFDVETKFLVVNPVTILELTKRVYPFEASTFGSVDAARNQLLPALKEMQIKISIIDVLKEGTAVLSETAGFLVSNWVSGGLSSATTTTKINEVMLKEVADEAVDSVIIDIATNFCKALSISEKVIFLGEIQLFEFAEAKIRKLESDPEYLKTQAGAEEYYEAMDNMMSHASACIAMLDPMQKSMGGTLDIFLNVITNFVDGFTGGEYASSLINNIKNPAALKTLFKTPDVAKKLVASYGALIVDSANSIYDLGKNADEVAYFSTAIKKGSEAYANYSLTSYDALGSLNLGIANYLFNKVNENPDFAPDVPDIEVDEETSEAIDAFNVMLRTFRTTYYPHNSTYKDNNSSTYGIQCFGYANYLANYMFGGFPAADMSGVGVNSGWIITHGGDAVDNLCVGDIVRYWKHSIFITGIDGDTIYYTDANSDGKNTVHWDKTTTRSILKTKVDAYLTSGTSSIDGKQYTGWVAHKDGWLGVTSSTPSVNREHFCSNCISVSKGGYVDVDTALRVRTGPGTSYSSPFYLEPDEPVGIHKQCNGWYYITDIDGKDGWVSGDYVVITHYDGVTIDTKFHTPIKAYTLNGRTYDVYDEIGGEKSGGWINSSDLCIIEEVYTNGWMMVTYPKDSGGTIAAYVPSYVFIENGYTPVETMSGKDTDIYTHSDMLDYFGYVAYKDPVLLVGSKDGYTQIVYPLDSGGYKMGWTSFVEYHEHSYTASREYDHPHRGYMRCSCGDWYYLGSYYYDASCIECTAPEMPVISISKTSWIDEETVTFSWQACERADYYFPMIYDSDGNRVAVCWGTGERSFSADLAVGTYYLQVASVNDSTGKTVYGGQVEIYVDYPNGACGDGVSWKLYDKERLVIFGSGAMYNYNTSNQPWKKYASSIKRVDILSGVTTIGSYAFYNFSAMDSVSISPTVATIGTNAFFECNDLIYVFITDIAAWCNIKYNAYTDNPFRYAHYLMLNNSLVIDLVIPSSAKKVSHYAFSGCDSLMNVTISEGITSIGATAFHGCKNLETISIPSTVSSISIFSTFARCPKLREINVASKNASYASVDGVLYNKAKTELVQFPAGKSSTNYRVLSTTTKIGYGAFMGCTTIPKVTLPKGVTAIDDGAFSDCQSLNSINIPENVTRIGVNAFNNCISLTEITIPQSVTSIDNTAFALCKNLVIRCYENSAAHKYAVNNKVKFTLVERLEIKGYALLLEGNVGIKFYLDHNASDISKISATFTYEGVKYDADVQAEGSDTYAIFYVAPKDMHKKVTFYATMGSKYATLTASVVDYVETIKSKPTEFAKALDLVDSMYNYGEYARKYFKKETISPTSDMTQSNLNLSGSYVPSKTGKVYGIEHLSTSLLLESNATIRHYFILDGKNAQDFEFKYDGKVLPVTVQDGICYVDIPNIVSSKLGTMFVVTVSDGVFTQKISYSPMTYAVQVLSSKESNADLVSLMKAMYYYYVAARNYFK